MAYKTGTVTGHDNLFETIRSFLKNVGYFSTPVYTGTGNGLLKNVTTKSGTVAETITIACTAAATNSGTFSVTGSVSGAIGTATVGTLFTSTKIDFLISDGSVDFVVTDQWTIATTAKDNLLSSGTWTELEYSDDKTNKLALFSAPGLSGTEAIYTGMKTNQSVASDYYNMSIFAATGYVNGNSYATQPGYSGSFGCPFWNQAIVYYLVANGQRCICVAKVDNTYVSFYMGKILPYATPGQWPYPNCISSMFTSESTTRYSDTSYNNGLRGNPQAVKIFFVDGTWKNPYIHPYSVGWLNGNSPAVSIRNTNTDYNVATGYYSLSPLILHDNTNTYGELDGLYFITGYNNAIENTLVISGETYFVFNNVTRTGFGDYFALKCV